MLLHATSCLELTLYPAWYTLGVPLLIVSTLPALDLHLILEFLAFPTSSCLEIQHETSQTAH